MQSEEYYAYRDSAIRSIIQSFEKCAVSEIDRMTHEVIYEANKWRSKFNLTRYKEIEEKEDQNAQQT